ncbi:MAG: sulfatase-like hydrolase/transferase [Tepidisphaeraceae bacterium]|jgi:arylsulfatase A
MKAGCAEPAKEKLLMRGYWILAGLLCIGSMAVAAAPPGKPNIIFVLADDLGLDGVSCYGADKHKTPHIDALAASGIRFETCYAAPLCGPSRCVLQTGRYAFRTGGVTNQSWRAGGPGARSADEFPIARLMKQAGYATGQAGKWRQIGETPRDWGYDEYLTDQTAGGWYWETRYQKNGREINLPAGTYGPDLVQEFTVDFLRRHKDHPFFFYYATHLVHKPTLRTPDTAQGVKNIDRLYDDNIRYMDKQVGALVAELEQLGLRQNTLIIFAGDNGTAAGYPSTVGGRMIHGAKGSMLEGGSRVPFIASWPAVTPTGKVLPDIVSFADPYVSFAELAGAKLPDGFKLDGHSFAPQLRGEVGTPRPWAYVQLDGHWYVRDPGFKLNQAGELFDMSDAPFTEKPIAPAADTEQSKAARQRLGAVLAELNPAAGKTDRAGGRPKAQRRKAAELDPADGIPYKVVTASSVENDEHDAGKVNDDAPDTYWCADDDSDGVPEFWQADLEKPTDLSGCAILWQFDGKQYQYQVEGSADGQNWSVLNDQTKNTRRLQQHELKFDTAKGIRFVRITVTGVEDGCWVGIREVKVFGQARAGG